MIYEFDYMIIDIKMSGSKFENKNNLIYKIFYL